MKTREATRILTAAMAALLVTCAWAGTTGAYALGFNRETAAQAEDVLMLSMLDFQPLGEDDPAIDRERPATGGAVPNAWPCPEGARSVSVSTPDGSYESDDIAVDTALGEITVHADGTAVLLDSENVVVYDDPDAPRVYPAAICDVVFDA